MKIVCKECMTCMSNVISGVEILELDNDGNPYQLWHADEYWCSNCGRTNFAGFSQAAITRADRTAWIEVLKKYAANEFNYIVK